MAKTSKTLKTGVPKANQLKDYEYLISLEINNIDHFSKVLTSAVPEIGRQMAKANGWNGDGNMKTLSVATSINSALDHVGVSSYHQQAREYAAFNEFDSSAWNATDKCGNETRNDFQDLYEQPEYEIIIRATAKLKDRNELAKRGVK